MRSTPRATLTFVNATIAYNQASQAGGGFDVAGGTATLYNTLVASNTAGSRANMTPNDITGTLASASSNNLVTSTGFSGGLSGSDNLVGALSRHRRGTCEQRRPHPDHRPPFGQPGDRRRRNSISGVTVPSIDQRGAVRGLAGLNAGPRADIGAYEASSSYVVSTTDDTLNAGTLRTGVSWANVSTNVNPENRFSPAPNTVDFSATGTIELTGGTLALANNGGTSVAKSIQGPGPGILSISGGNASGVFSVASGVTASISGLTVTGGLAAINGGAIDNSGMLKLSNLAVTGNSAAFGGGVANELTGSLTVANSTFSQNTAKTFGGAILNSHTLVLSGDTFTTNSASNGAAIANLPGSSLSITESTLTSNAALNIGGGIYNQGTASITNSSLVSNTGTTGGAHRPAFKQSVHGHEHHHCL